MRYRELIINKIENIEGKLKVLHFLVSRNQPIEEYFQNLSLVEETLAEVKTLISSEPLTHEEGYGLQ